MASGSCNCGAVTFECELDVQSELFGVFVCHCSICRRATGSAGIAVVLVHKDAFAWTSGEDHIRTWRKPQHDWQTWFCAECGAPVPGVNDDARMFIPAGSISEGGEALKVIHHIWVDSRASWDRIGDSAKQHPEAFVP